MCLYFSRIVSESKTLVNGIDTCIEQMVTPDQNKMVNSSFTEQSNSVSLLPLPVNSTVADSTEASVSGSSWFSSLTTVVDSPNSYPKWHGSNTAVSLPYSATSCLANSSHLSTSVTDPHVEDGELEPPAKRQLLEQTSSPPAEDDVSTTAVVAPLLGQLLSSPMDNSEKQHDDDDADDCTADAAAHSPVHSSEIDSSADLTCTTSDDSVSDVPHEGFFTI